MNLEKCSNCNSKDIIKKGKRKNKNQTIQKYYCKNCKKFFANSLLKNKTYPPLVILKAISFYNQGYSFEKSKDAINKAFKLNLKASTIHKWLNEFKELTAYRRIRDQNLKYYKPKEIIVKKTFRHNEQPYKYQYHKAKINFLKYFSALKQYLIEVKDNCPNNLFENPENKNRASRLKLNLKFQIQQKENYAVKLANLALKASNINKQRHQIIQDFMLINDTATIATEVPIYYVKTGLTGHIDILQLRFDKVHILDYKPEADKIHPESQLYLYARALSLQTKIPLSSFRCAWFDDEDYFEFDPSLRIENS